MKTSLFRKVLVCNVIDLQELFVVLLPEPTTAFFWFGERLRSFQGPVDLP